MKKVFYLLAFLPFVTQAQITDLPISREAIDLLATNVCDCLNESPKDSTITQETFQTCIVTSFTESLEEMQALTDVNLSELDDALGKRIGVEMGKTLLTSCPAFLRFKNGSTQGKLALEAANLAGAGKNVEALLKLNKLFVLTIDKTLFNQRGEVKLQLRDFYGALADFEYALQQDSTYAVAYNNRAVAKQRLGDTQGALGDYARALSNDSTQALFYSNRGVLFYDNEDYESAEPDLRRASRLNPESSGEPHLLGELFRLTDRLQPEGLAFYDQAIRLDPKNDSYLNNRGLFHWAKKETALAKKDFEQAVKLNPENQSAYYNLGTIAFEEKAYPEALKLARQALAAGDTTDNYLLLAADALREMGKTRESLAVCEAGLRFNPRNATFHDKKALIFSKTGELRQALQAYNQSLELYPNDGSTQYERGLIKLKLQDKAGACEDFWMAKLKKHEPAATAISEHCQR